MNAFAVVVSIAPESCKFALTNRTRSSRPALSRFVEYRVADLAGIDEALHRYQAHLGEPLPSLLGLAVAAPVHGDRIHVTQSGWSVSQQALKARFGFERVLAINDAAASAMALGHGDVADALPVAGSAGLVAGAMAHGRYALINLDFGLGVAGVVVDAAGPQVIDTEAGHLTFAPQDALQARLAATLQQSHGRVSYERLLAWPALSQLHALVCVEHGRPSAPLSPLEIILAARSGADPLCAVTLGCYGDILGAFAGDVALALGADRAVVLSGRFAFEAHEAVDWNAFRRRFEAKGRLSSLVARLDTLVLTNSTAVIVGVARRVQMELEPVAAASPPSPTSGSSGVAGRELLETIASGVLVLDPDLGVVASNTQFWAGNFAPDEVRQPGAPVERAFEWMAQAGQWSAAAAAAALAALTTGRPFVLERLGAGGAVLRDEARRHPDGRWVITSQDITRSAKRALELEATAAELRLARNAADAANQTKSAFLATMSHEIRTPLNGILGMAQAIAADRLPPTQRERLEIIRQSGEALLAILNDILDLAKIEAGQLELEAEEFELKQVLLGGYSAFTALANKKGLSFVLSITPGSEGVYRGDPTRVRQILYNVISNAIKFTSSGQVSVAATWRGDGVAFVVSDTGIGIDPERLPALFDRFVQADASTTRKYGGTGLGLAVCKELAERMGGSITAQSRVGGGSIFTVTLPLQRLEDAQDEGPARHAPGEPSYGSAPAPLPLKVLAAEDNEVNRLVLRTLLHQLGVEVVTVEDGEAALARWEAEPWDIILMDIQMPRMDGVAATRHIRQREIETGRPRVPIIALTANVMSYQLEQYIQAGMDHHVAKPIQAAELFGAIVEQIDKLDAEDRPVAPVGAIG